MKRDSTTSAVLHRDLRRDYPLAVGGDGPYLIAGNCPMHNGQGGYGRGMGLGMMQNGFGRGMMGGWGQGAQ